MLENGTFLSKLKLKKRFFSHIITDTTKPENPSLKKNLKTLK